MTEKQRFVVAKMFDYLCEGIAVVVFFTVMLIIFEWVNGCG